jgi:secretion/DNA translocation related CpaE-like protein
MPEPVVVRTVALLSASPMLVEQVSRLAVAAGAPLQVAAEPAEVRRLWAQATLVLLGTDVAASLGTPPLRRSGVLLVDERDDEPALRRAVAAGAERVVCLPGDAPWVVERMGEAVEGARAAPVVGVVGACGGVGTTVLTAGLAVAAAQARLSCAAVDADGGGGDLGLLLDLDSQPGVRWGDLASAAGRLPSGDLGAALPHRDGVALLAAGVGQAPAVSTATVQAVLPALARGHDLVLVDLARGRHPWERSARAQCSVLLLVVPGEPRGVVGATSVLADLGDEPVDVRMVARVGRGGLDPRQVADQLGLPLAGQVRTDRRVHADAVAGVVRPRSSLGRRCRRVLADLAPAVPS